MSISGTTPVTAPIAPSSAGDTYPTHIAEYGKGGYQVVADNTERDNIPAARRTEDMLVYVRSTGITYILGPALTNGAWTVSNRGPQVVDNWAALASLNGSTIPNGTDFYVRCRATIGDGGEGSFWFDNTSVASAVPGMVIVPASGTGRFFRKYGPVLNALHFGALPQQALGDSTTALQAAINFASRPTYGWAASANYGYAALELYVPPGEYLVTGTLKNYGVRFFGKSAHYSGNYNADTVIHSKHSGHFMVFNYGGTDGPLGVADYRCGSLEDIVVEGYPETYPGTKIAITAVTDRTHFNVNIADLPTLDVVNPHMNVAFFYDDQGHWLGAGQISSIDAGTGEVTLTFGSDIYATVGGSVLRTSDKVIFTPRISAEAGITNFADPASAGPCGVFMKCDYNGAGNGPTLRNVMLSNFHVGLRVGPGLLERRVKDLKIVQCKYAGILYPREYNSTDSPYMGMTYITGGYRADYGKTFTNALTNINLCNTTVCWYGLGPYERVDIALVEGASWAQMIIQRGLGQYIGYMFCDLCVRHGLVVQRGYTVDTAAAVYDNTVAIDVFSAKTGLPGLAKFAPDAVHADRYAISVPNVGPSNPVVLNLGTVSVCDGGLGDFSHGIYIVPSVNNKVSINQVSHRWGTATWYTGQAPMITGIARNLTAAEAYTGIAETNTNEISIVNSGLQTGTWTSTGLTIAPETGFNPLTLTRRDTGSTMSFYVGSADSYFTYNNARSSVYNFSLGDASAVQFVLGAPNAAYAPRTCSIGGEVASTSAGTDVAPGDLYVIPPRGTGAASGGGRIAFQTPVVGASGTSVQSTTTRLLLRREGQLNFAQLSADPGSAGLGDLYSNSTNSKFRAYLNSKWGNLDRWTVRADTATTVTVNAHDELVTLSNANPITVNLPAGILNQRYAFKNIGVGTATLTPNGAEKLFTTAQVSTLALATGDYKLIQWDGTQWLVL